MASPTTLRAPWMCPWCAAILQLEQGLRCAYLPHNIVCATLQSIEHLRYYAGWADKIYGQTIPVDGKMIAYTLKEPLGAAPCTLLPLLAWLRRKRGPEVLCLLQAWLGRSSPGEPWVSQGVL